MAQPAIQYVEQTPEGSWRLCNSRVSLDSIVHAWRDGQSPETIAEEFPTISVEQVYGAIAFYLHNQDEIDRYLSDQDKAWETLQQQSEGQHGALLDRIRSRRTPPEAKGPQP